MITACSGWKVLVSSRSELRVELLIRLLLTTPATNPAFSAGLKGRDGVNSGVVVVKVPVTCERGALTLLVSVHESGLLTGLQLGPPSAAEPTAPWEPPAYADPERFDEQDVTVGSGPLAVPGTLSLPHQPGPRPAIVLLAGSGPLDRDETIGRNKLFKDLAWGLASRKRQNS